MTDRELLELAAKAAGIYLTIEWLGHEKYKPDWNPLTDDGDALRLAVQLRIRMLFPTEIGQDKVEIYGLNRHTEALFTDPYAATRRAITRAAAEIGRAMP